ncbi:phosphoribosylformylglycinamidine synthase [Clostridia bacterium]|nr:phosphoribosylformylglycinamidine synthase [Clostridia bacterium]
MIRRVFVEKKPGFDVESRQLHEELVENLGINLSNLRVLNLYDVEGLSADEWELAKRRVFSEPMADYVYDENIPVADGAEVFTVAYLPGQYNQRADSAAQCLRILGFDAIVETAKVYVLEDCGDLTAVKKHLINTVDSREIPGEKPETLQQNLENPQPIKVLTGFRVFDAEKLSELHENRGLAMSIEDLNLVQDYFRDTLKRDPTETEIRVLDTYWSDHCRHTTFQTQIERVDIAEGLYTAPIAAAFEQYRAASKRETTLMDVATIGAKQLKKLGKLNDLDESDEINACSIRVELETDNGVEPWLVMFKNETHNHPTEIEPFGGAATCLGGAIRDPLSGRSYVYQALRITGAGDPRTPVSATLSGKLPQKRITQQAAHGFSSYGNQIGLATGLVREIYDEGFVAKRMEIGAVVGAAPAANIVREIPAAGDVVLLVGGRTGRDGCGGATGSSKAHSESSILTCGAEVQKGNPVTERKLQRLFRNPEAARKIKRCNDFGAGGVAVAVGELADGLTINLDAVPKKYEGLDGTELAISESQERMAVVTRAVDADAFIALCNAENLEATRIAVVTDDRVLRMSWRGDTIVELPRELMDTNGARQTTAAIITSPADTTPFTPKYSDIPSLLSDLNVCSQRGLAERFDASIGAGTVFMPFGGKNQLTPAQSSVCKIPADGTSAATIMSHGYDPEIAKWSPFHGAVYAVVEALAKITAAGGDYSRARLTFQEYFEKLGRDPEKWGNPLAGLLGAYYAQIATGCAAIGGKDSMSGTYKDIHVPPTVVAFALAVADARELISPELKRTDSTLVLAPIAYGADALPDFKSLADTYAAVRELIKNGKVLAAHTVGRFGLAEVLPLMAFGNKIGIKVREIDLFKPRMGAIVLEMLDASKLPDSWQVIGETQSAPEVAGYPIDTLLAAWESTLNPIFPTTTEQNTPDMPANPIARKKVIIPRKPTVFLPIFPGTNCEYDSERAFTRAGAEVKPLVFRNLNAAEVEQSLQAMRRAIDGGDIIMLSGGFSAGDEPDGSAKFITAVFRNAEIAEATHRLLDRGGLILGICNGFQALLKLGLLTRGRISDTDEQSPTLTFNTIGRHISRIARTRIMSTNSPWLAGTRLGEVHNVPLSHGEGRFVCDSRTFQAMADLGQIATVYDGENPNGSLHGVEGIISPDGKIFGKMGHSERFSQHTYKNIPGNFDQKLFESACLYF